MRPTVLVHGIWDTAQRIAPLTRGLSARGVGPLATIDLVPRWGSATLEALAEQLARFVARVREEHAAQAIDLVGFSMGALVSRLYLQELGGRDHVRAFVSVSGPHRGTLTAYGLPLAGVRQMRPGSALLCRLGSDARALAPVRVHCVYTPYDLMIVPATSGVLEGAASLHCLPVKLHRWMVRDRRVLDLVAGLLLRF